MSNDKTLVIAAVAVGAFLLLSKKATAAQPGQVQANSSAWTNRYFQSPATAYMPNATQQRETSQAQLVAGGFGVLGQLINKWNSPAPAAFGGITYAPPDTLITNTAPTMPDYSSTNSGQVGDLSDFYG